MPSFDLDFTFDNVEHKVTLEITDGLSDKVVSIDGRNYKLLGSQEALAVLQTRLKNLPSSDFATLSALEMGGPAEKTASLFQKVVVKLSAQAVAEKIQKCGGSQDEVKKILFEFIPKKDFSRLMEVVVHLALEGNRSKLDRPIPSLRCLFQNENELPLCCKWVMPCSSEERRKATFSH